MAENQHIYAAIDLKSFYASVECVSRKLDTLTTNLVVADVTRSEKTICLAVSPSLKACGIPGRPRLFEVVQKVREVNRQRLADAVRAHKAVRGADGKWSFASSSFDAAALQKDLSLELGYIVAPPRMATYIEYSTPHLPDLSQVCGARGHPRLFHRRGFHRPDALSPVLPHDGPTSW